MPPPGGWWTAYFERHPWLAQKNPEVYTNPRSTTTKRPKSFCIACMSIHLARLKQQEEEEIQNGTRQLPSTDVDLKRSRKFISSPTVSNGLTQYTQYIISRGQTI